METTLEKVTKLFEKQGLEVESIKRLKWNAGFKIKFKDGTEKDFSFRQLLDIDTGNYESLSK